MPIMMPNPTSLIGEPIERMIEKYKRANTIKEQWRPVFEECYEYAMPARESFYATSAGSNRTDKIFDETAVTGVQEFASRLQAGIVPNYARWADFVAGTEVPEEERAEVNAQLDNITSYIFEVIQNSNFSQEVHESFLDLAVGTGGLLIEEGNATHPIRFTAVPLPYLTLDVGPSDAIDCVYRDRNIRASNILVAYPEADLPIDIKRDLTQGKDMYCHLVEGVHQDYTDINVEAYIYTVFSVKHKHILVQKRFEGQGSNPYVVFRWGKSSGEIWGRGPLLNTMPAVKTTNLVIELILENAQMAISGMYQLEDDGIINVDTIQLLPGTIIPRAAGSRGLEPVAQAGNFSVADLVLKDMRNNIRKALYNETLGDPNKTPMSATEVAERMADLSKQIGSAFGRLQAEMVQPVLQRVVHILKKQGRITLPVINGQEVKIQSTSPLAQAQANQDVSSFNRFLELVQARFGPQLINGLIDTNEATAYLANKLGIPEKLIRTPEEQQQMVEQMLKMQQAQQQQQPQQGQIPPDGQQ